MKIDKPVFFTVKGDPVPYLRMTQGQVKMLKIPMYKLSPQGVKVREKIERYFNWKEYVRLSSLKYPFDPAPKEKVYMDVMVYFSDKKHADPENIRKGIQDALFTQDKYVAGGVDFSYDPINPRCEIKISSVDRQGVIAENIR